LAFASGLEIFMAPAALLAACSSFVLEAGALLAFGVATGAFALALAVNFLTSDLLTSDLLASDEAVTTFVLALALSFTGGGTGVDLTAVRLALVLADAALLRLVAWAVPAREAALLVALAGAGLVAAARVAAALAEVLPAALVFAGLDRSPRETEALVLDDFTVFLTDGIRGVLLFCPALETGRRVSCGAIPPLSELPPGLATR
jgi:hypothetical protein